MFVADLLKQVLSNTDLNLASELHLLLEHTNGTLGELRALIMGEFTVRCCTFILYQTGF